MHGLYMSSNLALVLETAHFTSSLSELDDYRMHFSTKPSDPDEISFLPPLRPLSISISLDSPSPSLASSSSTSSSSSSSSSSSPSSSPASSPASSSSHSLEIETQTPTQRTFYDPVPRDLECTICSHPIGTPFFTNHTAPQVETAVTLPCGHIYGNLCITKWLEKKSIHQDCPDCRRRMVHKGCGHFVVPRIVGRAPPVVGKGEWAREKGSGMWLGCGGGSGGMGEKGGDGEDGLEGDCLRCRGCKVVGEIVKSEKERLEMEVKVVKGLWEGLRSVFGIGGSPIGIGGRNSARAVKERVDERRREFERIWDGAWEVWEREEGSRRW